MLAEATPNIATAISKHNLHLMFYTINIIIMLKRTYAVQINTMPLLQSVTVAERS